MRIPSQIAHLVSKTVRQYLNAPAGIQRLVRITYTIQGRCGKYVFQMSNGTQQIKLYEPHKYRNEVNTPLRLRVRTIMILARQHPEPDVTEILRELFRTYPYYLLRSEPVNLRLKNFYFEGRVVIGDTMRIYKAVDPLHPNPDLDELISEELFQPKRTVRFDYEDEDEEYFYAVNERTEELSNLLHFVWGDELPPAREAVATIDENPVKMKENTALIAMEGDSTFNNIIIADDVGVVGKRMKEP